MNNLLQNALRQHKTEEALRVLAEKKRQGILQ